MRTFYGRRSPEHGGWEVGYFGICGPTATNRVGAIPPDFVHLPDPLSVVLTTDGECVTA